MTDFMLLSVSLKGRSQEKRLSCITLGHFLTGRNLIHPVSHLMVKKEAVFSVLSPVKSLSVDECIASERESSSVF